MGRVVFTVILACLLVWSPVADAGQIRELGELRIVDRVGQSALVEAGPVRVLLLQGSPYQIGYAHGRLASTDVRALVDCVLTVSRAADLGRGEVTDRTLEDIYRRTLPYIPARYREELAGLADGAGIDRHRVALANIFPEMFHCSGFALMGKATQGGQLIHGRVLDYMTQVGLQERAMVSVIRSAGCNAVMTAGYAGFIGSVTGMNDRHVAMGEMGMGGNGLWDGLPMAYMLRQVLEENDSLDAVLKAMKRMTLTCEYAYVVSDSKTNPAAAVHAKPGLLEFVFPGQTHPLLPKPVDDCVLVSGGDRYGHLVERVTERYGQIDVPAAIEIIKRPVAMQSNLHNAIMLPADGVMYLANASDRQEGQSQACYQPYYKYELKTFLAMLDDLARKHKPTQPERIPLGQVTTAPATTRATAKTGQERVRLGTVSRDSFRPLKPAENAKMAAVLERYQVKCEPFDWRMRKLTCFDEYTIWEVSFPSPYTSPDPENNVVWCEYFKSNQPGPKPGVVVLHIAANDFKLPRVICHSLSVAGIDALLVKMAYYGPRRPKDPKRVKSLTDDVDTLVAAVQQSVMDVRRAARFLAEQDDVDEDRIGLCGVSLGALVGALTVGVDGTVGKAALVLGGGDLAGIVRTESREVRTLNTDLKQNNIGEAELRARLEPIEPLTFAHRAEATKVLMINARNDKVVPPTSAEKLAAGLPTCKIVWYDADHYSALWYLMDALAKIRAFFIEE